MRSFNRPFAFGRKDIQELAKDVKEAFHRLYDDLAAAEQSRPQRFLVGPVDVSMTPATLVLVPRAPADGLKLGRIVFVVTADVAQSASSYWQVKIGYYRTVAGIRRLFELVEWITTSFGLTAFEPYEKKLDQTLLEGDVLVATFTATGSPDPLDGLTIQTDEMYGD